MNVLKFIFIFFCFLTFFSDALYGDLFSSIADVLGAMFRQCHQVHSRFFVVITTNIKFDTSVETDIVHLVDGMLLRSSYCNLLTALYCNTNLYYIAVSIADTFRNRRTCGRP